MNKALLTVAAVMALVSVAFGYIVYTQAQDAARLEQAVASAQRAASASESARKRADEALVSLRQKNAATARETVVKQHSLSAANAASAAWAAQPVPEEVQNALR